MVVQSAVNRQVVGSYPTSGARFKWLTWKSICSIIDISNGKERLFSNFGFVAQLVRAPACHAGG